MFVCLSGCSVSFEIAMCVAEVVIGCVVGLVSLYGWCLKPDPDALLAVAGVPSAVERRMKRTMAAMKIQRVVRAWIARRRKAHAEFIRRLTLAKVRRMNAAKKMFQVSVHQHEKTIAAAKIQRICRVWLFRQRLTLKMAEKHRQQDHAAVMNSEETALEPVHELAGAALQSHVGIEMEYENLGMESTGNLMACQQSLALTVDMAIRPTFDILSTCLGLNLSEQAHFAIEFPMEYLFNVVGSKQIYLTIQLPMKMETSILEFAELCG